MKYFLILVNIVLFIMYVVFYLMVQTGKLHNPYRLWILDYYGNIFLITQLLSIIVYVVKLKIVGRKWNIIAYRSFIVIIIYILMDLFVNNTLWIFQTV
jgi:hypothetical protein